MRNSQINWGIAVGAVVLLGTAVVTLRAAERATQHEAAQTALRDTSANVTEVRAGPEVSIGVARGPIDAKVHATADTKIHPPASAPEESATIADDPTTAPDPSQSADNNVSFPTDI